MILSNLRINLRQLNALVVLAEVKNFTKAAQILHVTQAGLSAMIKELEGQLEMRLFDRSPRHVVLTLAGQEFINHAQQAINHINSGLLTLQAFRRRQAGGVRIGVAPLIATTLLPRVVMQFTQMYPYGCDVVDDETEELHRLLAAGSLDAVYSMDRPWQKSLNHEYLFSSKMVFICHEDFLAGKGGVSIPEDWEYFKGETLLALPQHHRIQRIIDNFMMEHGLAVEERKELRHMATIMSFVGMKRGIAFVPALVATREPHGVLSSISIPGAPIAMDYHCVTRSDEPVPDSIHAFSDLLSEAARQIEERT